MAEIKIYGTLLNDTAEPIVYAEQITVKETGENLLDLTNNGNSVTVEGKCVLPFAGVRDDVTLEASSHSGAEGEHYYASNLKKFVHSPSGGVALPGETAKHYISYDYNDCSDGAPDGPMTDKIYLNTTDHKLYVWNGTELVVVGGSAADVEAAKEKWIDVFMPFDTFIANGEVLDEVNFSIESSLVNYTFDHIKNARGFRIYDAEYDGDHDLSNLCAIQAFRAYLSDDMTEDYFYGSYKGKMFAFEFNGTAITTVFSSYATTTTVTNLTTRVATLESQKRWIDVTMGIENSDVNHIENDIQLWNITAMQNMSLAEIASYEGVRITDGYGQHYYLRWWFINDDTTEIRCSDFYYKGARFSAWIDDERLINLKYKETI